MYLTAHAGLSALIGDRLYPMRLPEGVTFPAMTYQRISTPRMRSHSGPSGLASPRFQYDCWDVTYAGAGAVARELRLALDGYRGGMGQIETFANFLEDERDDFDPATDQFRVIVDAIVWHREAVA